MNQKDRSLLKKVREWLKTKQEGKEEREIDASLHEIKYEVENFIKGIRFHTERFRDEIGGGIEEALESLEKSQFVSSGEFLREIQRQIEFIERGGNIPVAFALMGNSLFFLGELNLAARCLERSIDYLPVIPAFFNNLGCCYFRQRHWIKAKRMFQKALDLQPDDRDAVWNLERTEREFSNQKKIDYWMGKGNSYFLEGSLDKSESCYKKAIEIGGQMPETLFNLGNIYFKRGKDTKAEDLYSRAIQENPNYAPAYASLGKLKLRQGHLEAAFENLQRAFVLDASLHDALALMGDISFKWGNYPQALELYEAYLKQHPESDTTLMLIGDCYLQMGKTEAARYAYEALEKRGKQTPMLEERLRRVGKA